MKMSVVKTLYLYLATLLGLLLLAIGSIQLLSLGLRTYVFTQADQEYSRNFRQQPAVPIGKLESIESGEIEGKKLSQDDIEALQRAAQNFREQEKLQAGIDLLTARRHRELSTSLAMILVGLPLYLYHWGIVKKEKHT